MSFRSDISKLIFHHLVKEGYESSANNLVHECPYLIELKPVQPPYKLPRLMGASLVNLIENYFETKEKIIEQLELLESVVFREQDDLLNLAKILVENLKFKTPSTFQGQKETSDASVNTELARKTPETCDASVNTESATPETCDASVNTESISTPQSNDSSCNTECVSNNKPETCDASVNTDVFNHENNDPSQLSVENSKVPKEMQDTNEIVPHVIDSSKDVPNQLLSQKSPATLSTTQVSKYGCERSMNMNTAWVLNHVLQGNSTHCPEQLEVSADNIDFSLVYDCLLEDRDLQEKIAENINKNKVILPNKGSSKRGSLASSQDLDTIIKAIIAETQTDPAFDDFLKDCIGSPDQDYWESTVSDNNNRENQENSLIPGNLGAPTIVKPSNIASPLFAVQNPNLPESSSVISGLNGLAFLTFSGQTTLVPTIISPMPSNNAVPSVGEKRKKKNPIVRTPVSIAPKPALTITIPAPDRSYQFTNAADQSEFFQHRVKDQQQLLECNIETINVKTGPSATKPMKVKNRPLTKLSTRRKVAITGNRVIQASPNPHSLENFITPGLAALVKIAQEYGSSTSMDIQDHEAVIEKELLTSPVVIFNSHISNSTNFVSTPISTRRLSHARQLNSGELRALSNNPASISPIVHPKRSKIPRVLALRNAVAAPPDDETFGTPIGKATRRRKSSPAPLIETESDEMANAPVMEMASVESLQQMALENGINERIAPESNLSNFGMNIITLEEPVIQQPLPVLATPQKEITKNVAVVNSLNSFGPWAGEIPRTPQIQLDLTRSASPFQVLLTKGFRFLPAAESPNLPLPATPRIFEVNSSSIETPYTGFYQFPSVLSTPRLDRLETLHQEVMESPGKSLGITVVSPTPVVLDHPTPYFAPSGEQAQVPLNQNTTPEHVSETEKSERRRRTKNKKTKTSVNSKTAPGSELVNSACARAQIYSSSPQSHRRKSRRLSNTSKPSTPREDEEIIQEVLTLSRLNSSVDSVAQSSPLNNRKRRLNSTGSEKIGLTNKISSEKKSKRKRSNFPNVSDVRSEEHVLATNEVISIPSTSSSITVPIR